MTKLDLIIAIAEKSNITRANSERALNAILGIIESALVKDGRIVLTGFGSFTVEKRKARTGRNPGTGSKICIPEENVVKFRPGKILKAALGTGGGGPGKM